MNVVSGFDSSVQHICAREDGTKDVLITVGALLDRQPRPSVKSAFLHQISLRDAFSDTPLCNKQCSYTMLLWTDAREIT